MLEETHDSEEIIGRVAALDIGKAELVCCVRVPSTDTPGKRTGGSADLPDDDAVAAWHVGSAAAAGVTRVVMEATSDYWKSPFSLLEAQGFEVWLVNARDARAPAGAAQD